MPAEPARSLDARRRAFAALVKRLIENAQAKGMTTREIQVAGGVGKTKYYQWRAGHWTRDPNASEVRSFFTGLGGSVAEAYEALQWREQPRPRRKATEPIVDDPDLHALARKLLDPKTPNAQKQWIRRQIRRMAGLD